MSTLTCNKLSFSVKILLILVSLFLKAYKQYFPSHWLVHWKHKADNSAHARDKNLIVAKQKPRTPHMSTASTQCPLPQPMASDNTKSFPACIASKLILYLKRLKKNEYKCFKLEIFLLGLCDNCSSKHEHSSLLGNTSFCPLQKKDDSFISLNLRKVTSFDTSSNDNVQVSDGIFSPQPKFISFSGIVKQLQIKFELSMDCKGLSLYLKVSLLILNLII